MESRMARDAVRDAVRPCCGSLQINPPAMFVVAARHGPASGEGGLQTFIDRQIDAAKAPAKMSIFCIRCIQILL